MADFLSVFSLDAVMNFIFGNILWIALIGVVGYILYHYLKFGFKSRIKPINRADVERVEFINRMKYNKPTFFKWLVRGNALVGKIQSLSFAKVIKKGNPETKEIDVMRMVVRPTLFSKYKIINPLAKSICFEINKDVVKDTDIKSGEIQLPSSVNFDFLFGIYYDGSVEELHTDFIKQDNLFRTDLNQLASIYFAKSQEQSTFDPDKAHELAMKEKELQIEMAKKKGKVTSI